MYIILVSIDNFFYPENGVSSVLEKFFSGNSLMGSIKTLAGRHMVPKIS